MALLSLEEYEEKLQDLHKQLGWLWIAVIWLAVIFLVSAILT